MVMKSLTLALLQVEALGAWGRGSLQPHRSVPIGQKSGRKHGLAALLNPSSGPYSGLRESALDYIVLNTVDLAKQIIILVDEHHFWKTTDA